MLVFLISKKDILSSINIVPFPTREYNRITRFWIGVESNPFFKPATISGKSSVKLWPSKGLVYAQSHTLVILSCKRGFLYSRWIWIRFATCCDMGSFEMVGRVSVRWRKMGVISQESSGLEYDNRISGMIVYLESDVVEVSIFKLSGLWAGSIVESGIKRLLDE